MGELSLLGFLAPDNSAAALVGIGRPPTMSLGSGVQCCRRSNSSTATRRIPWMRITARSGATSGAACQASFSLSPRFYFAPSCPGATDRWNANERMRSPDRPAVCASSFIAARAASITEDEHQVRTGGTQTHDGGKKSWLRKAGDILKIPNISSADHIRKLLVKMGCSAVLAYGFVSSISNICLIIASWYIFWMRTGLSPLSQGQWGAFLLTYIALYGTIGNLLRPVRIILAAAIGPTFDGIVSWFQKKLDVNKPIAIAATCFLINGIGSGALLLAGLLGASAFTGMPILVSPSASAPLC